MEQSLIDEFLAHAADDYPNEACGVLARNEDDLRYIRCQNIAANPREDFTLCPHDLGDAEAWGDVVGIVHSHPDATTQPSDRDQAMCDSTGLPWHIVSYPEGDFRTICPREEVPLIGRPFVLGVYDCWGLIMSYFQQEHGIELRDYRVDFPWWEEGRTENFYQDCWHECGFREFAGPPQPGDMVIMQVQAPRWNHAGILLEGNMLLHHLYGRLSQRTPYGGYWRERTMKIVRHKDLMRAYPC